MDKMIVVFMVSVLMNKCFLCNEQSAYVSLECVTINCQLRLADLPICLDTKDRLSRIDLLV